MIVDLSKMNALSFLQFVAEKYKQVEDPATHMFQIDFDDGTGEGTYMSMNMFLQLDQYIPKEDIH